MGSALGAGATFEFRSRLSMLRLLCWRCGTSDEVTNLGDSGGEGMLKLSEDEFSIESIEQFLSLLPPDKWCRICNSACSNCGDCKPGIIVFSFIF